MNWYYIDGPLRVGPINETEWAELVASGKILPETLVWHEGVEKWTPYRLMTPLEVDPPDFEEVLETKEESPEEFAARVVDLDYPVDFDRCISQAWKVFKSNFWELVGATLLIFAAIVAGAKLPILEYAVPMLLQGVLMGGLYKIYLYRLRGQPSVFTDLFAGFEPSLFKQLALQNLVSALVSQMCFIPVLIAMKMKEITFQNLQETLTGDPQIALVLMLVFLACAIPAIYFSFCWMFALPLIVDKGMAFWPAMQLSRAKVLQHPWRISVLLVIAGIVAISGMLGFGLGVVFTLPLYFLIELFQYEDIFNPPIDARFPEEL